MLTAGKFVEELWYKNIIGSPAGKDISSALPPFEHDKSDNNEQHNKHGKK